MDLVVIDGANTYNSIANVLKNDNAAGKKDHVDAIKPYMREWFDFDRFVARALNLETPPRLGTVVFHSDKKLGGGFCHLDKGETDAFWARQGTTPHTSTILVALPGEQIDKFDFDCENCKHTNHVERSGEKGIDTAIVTYLFETADAWTSACLFSRDVDFAPAVEALRRRGKQIFVCCEPRAKNVTALERVAQSVFPLNTRFLFWDLFAYRLLRKNGFVDEVVRRMRNDPHTRVVFHDGGGCNSLSDCQLHIAFKNGTTLNREELVRALQVEIGGFPGIHRIMIADGPVEDPVAVAHICLDDAVLQGVRRRLDGMTLDAEWTHYPGRLVDMSGKFGLF